MEHKSPGLALPAVRFVLGDFSYLQLHPSVCSAAVAYKLIELQGS